MKWFKRKKKDQPLEATPEASVEATVETDAAQAPDAAIAAVEDGAAELPVAPDIEPPLAVEGEMPAESVNETEPEPEPEPEPKQAGLLGRLSGKLRRTSSTFSDGVGRVLLGKKIIDENLMEELETQLIMADVGMEATRSIIDNLGARVKRKELADGDALQRALELELTTLLKPLALPLEPKAAQPPFVILMVGVNGVGKTTTIGKLAKRYLGEGKSVMLAAGDTFRAAAVEQLQVWGERNDVPVVAQHTGADSASVIFDALQAAQSRGVDVLIADTAGRLHNKENLMDELKKVVRVMSKLDEHAPHEVMLVLDGGTGQNALSQATHFGEAVGVTGLTLTKLDGTAKGGIIFAIAKQLALPIRFIGVGEQAEDLRPFVAEEFVSALFEQR